jgi:tetratricopeptide (TPR) repeat protein
MAGMTEDLDARLRRLPAADAPALIALGRELVGAGRLTDAEECFRRAAALGNAVAAFALGNALAAQERWSEASVAYEAALAGGEAHAWRTLGVALNEMGDEEGALAAWRGAADGGDAHAAAVLASRQWARTQDPALEAALRAATEVFPPARADLADLLRETDRAVEARFLLEVGAKRGEPMAWLPLGNLYCDELGDDEAAEEAYRSGISAGDVRCHHNLGVLLVGRGDHEGAAEQFALGAEAGDELAMAALRLFQD